MLSLTSILFFLRPSHGQSVILPAQSSYSQICYNKLALSLLASVTLRLQTHEGRVIHRNKLLLSVRKMSQMTYITTLRIKLQLLHLRHSKLLRLVTIEKLAVSHTTQFSGKTSRGGGGRVCKFSSWRKLKIYTNAGMNISVTCCGEVQHVKIFYMALKWKAIDY